LVPFTNEPTRGELVGRYVPAASLPWTTSTESLQPNTAVSLPCGPERKSQEEELRPEPGVTISTSEMHVGARRRRPYASRG
jgi:hypothetical protein